MVKRVWDGEGKDWARVPIIVFCESCMGSAHDSGYRWDYKKAVLECEQCSSTKRQPVPFSEVEAVRETEDAT